MAITARIGVEPTPFDMDASESFSETEIRAAAALVVRAGVDNVSVSTAWSAVEPSAGTYVTDSIGWIVAERGTAKLQLTITVLDYTGARTTPAYLSSDALDSTAVKDAYKALVDELHTVIGEDGLDILVLGNEVENYLSVNASDITPFANLIADVKTYVTGKTGWAAVKVVVSFRHDSVSAVTTTYAAVLAACSMGAFTYYPINPDFTVQDDDPDTIGTTMFNDLLALPSAIGSTVLLTEVGLPPHVDLGSSLTLHASFYGQVAAVVQSIADFDGIYSAQMHWLTDWPDWLLDAIGATGNLRKFLGSLGLRTNANLEQPAWDLVVSALGGTSFHQGWARPSNVVISGAQL